MVRSSRSCQVISHSFQGIEIYSVCQGEVFLDRFDALSYLYLTRLLDYFDPFADAWTAERLAAAVTRFQGELIQVIDVESVLADICQSRMDATLAPEMALPADAPPMQVLVVDDSRVARSQIRSVLEQLGVTATLLSDGRQALDHLLQVHAAGENPAERYAMVISDIEMPAMDGYTLTTEIRRHPGLAGLYVLLHTSLSGVFNNAMVERVGANAFVAKYSPHELAEHVLFRLNQVAAAQMAA